MEVNGIKVSSATAIDLSKQKLLAPDEMAKNLGFGSYQDYLTSLQGPETTTFNNPIDPNHPLNQPYAQVTIRDKNGKNIAVDIDNNGFLQVPNNFFSKFGISMDVIDSWSHTTGPELAKIRAEKVAEMTGGTIKLASTAITDTNQYPKSFTYTREELEAEGILSLASTLKMELAKFKYQSQQP